VGGANSARPKAALLVALSGAAGGVQGDAGLEGFSDDGMAYQCYAAREPVSDAILHTHQQTKIQRDIRKFKKKARLEKVLGKQQIGIWNLVVPRFTSTPLVAYANEKAAEVRAAKLSYVTDDFAIRIIDDEYFQVEIQQLGGVGLAGLDIHYPVHTDDPEGWASDAVLPAWLSNLDDKLKKITAYTNDAARAKARRTFLERYRVGQSALDALRSRAPEVHDAAWAAKVHREGLLSSATILGGPQQLELLRSTLETFQADLQRDVLAIKPRLAEILAWEAVSDWLLRCPLDFD